jgi:ABC-2 type transport system ATP-binding protein
MIKTEDITKKYLRNKVLDNISVSIPDKTIAGIIGPNGAGKTTFLKIISGFEFPDSGIIYIDNKKVKKHSIIKRYLSYMPENMTLYPDYFVDEFLDFFHSAINHTDKELLDSLSLKSIFHKKIKHLSKGWHQRLKLYTALANKKPIIILDEPFDGFDPLQMRDIIKIFKSQNSKGRSFILSIHQLSDAQKICDYFILLDAGIKIAEGSIDSLSEKFSCKSKSLEDIFLKALDK